MPTVHVSEHVKQRLEEVKEAEDHSTLDSVVRVAIREYQDGE